MADLRIIYNNLIDIGSTTLSASSELNATTTPASNMETDLRSKIWRSATSSTTAVKVLLLATFTSAKPVTGVIAAFTNNSPAATFTVRGYTGTPPTLTGSVDTPTITGGTLAWTVGPTLACPPAPDDDFSWGGEDLNAYQDRAGYSRLWCPADTLVDSIVIEINDVVDAKYVEISRLIIGNYWSPTHNTGFGLSVDYKDTSRSERAESGSLITSVGTRHAVLNFDLEWMSPRDKIELNRLNRVKGTSGSLFVSLFPDNSEDWNKEQIYQIYGRLTNSLPITHPMYEFFSASMEIEEV